MFSLRSSKGRRWLLAALVIATATAVGTSAATSSPAARAAYRTATGTQISYELRAAIDGRSDLILIGDTVHWHHFDYAAPTGPTYLNGTSWVPTWPNPGENRDCHCDSSTYTGLAPPVPTDIQTAKLVPTGDGCRYSCTLTATSDRLIVHFNDNPPPGGAWYQVRVDVTAAGDLTLGALPSGTVGTAYDETVAASGGTAPYAFSVTGGSLPAGLTLSTGGRLHGTPTTAGASTFTVQALDSSTPAKEGARSYSLRVAPESGELVENGDFERPGITGPGDWHPGDWNGAGSVDLLPWPWPAASAAQAIDLNAATTGAIGQTLATVAGGTYNLTFAYAGNPDLFCGPQGIKRFEVLWGGASLGVFEFDTTGHSLDDLGWVRAARSVTATAASTELRFASQTAGCAGPTLDDIAVTPDTDLALAGLPPAQLGKPYDQTIGVTGGAAPYAFSELSGSLPPGLSLSAPGAVSGTPSAAGTSTFTVDASDSSSPVEHGSRVYPLTVVIPVSGVTSIVVSAPSSVVKGAVFAVTATAKDADGNRVTDYSGPAAWSSLDGALSPSHPADFVDGVSTTATAKVGVAFRADRITVTTAGVSGDSGVFDVVGPFAAVLVDVAMPVFVGVPFRVTATATDTAGNRV